MAATGPAADAIGALEGAAEALQNAENHWQKYIKSLDEAKTKSTRHVEDAKSAASEIQKLRKGVKALSQRLQAASTP